METTSIAPDKVEITERLHDGSYKVICQLKQNRTVGICEVRGNGWVMTLNELEQVYDAARNHFAPQVLEPINRILPKWVRKENIILSIEDYDHVAAVCLSGANKGYRALFNLRVFKNIYLIPVGEKFFIYCLYKPPTELVRNIPCFITVWNEENKATPSYPVLVQYGESIALRKITLADEIINTLEILTNNFSRKLVNTFREFRGQ